VNEQLVPTSLQAMLSVMISLLVTHFAGLMF
jgi:hypothetical protein